MPDAPGRAAGTTRGAAHGELWVGACLLRWRAGARGERAAAQLLEGPRRPRRVSRPVELQDVVLRRGAAHRGGRTPAMDLAEAAAASAGIRGCHRGDAESGRAVGVRFGVARAVSPAAERIAAAPA